MQKEEYDTSFIRHEMEVPVEQIRGMSVGQRALLKTEQESRRLDSYEEKVRGEVGDTNYTFSRFKRENKEAGEGSPFWGLVIKRIK